MISLELFFFTLQNVELLEKYTAETEVTNKYKKSFRDLQQGYTKAEMGYKELKEQYRELEEAKHSLESRHYQLQTALEQERNARTDSSELIKELESE